MNSPWLLRVAVTLICAASGAVLVHLLGANVFGVALGASLGAAAWVLVDGLAAERVVAWLQRGTPDPAPRMAGLWAELAYRIERALRQREDALTRQQQRHTQLLDAIEASPNGVLLLDANDHIEWCSQRAAAHLGLDPQRDAGQHVTNLVRYPAFVACLAQGDDATPALFEGPAGGTVSTYVCRYGEGSRLVITQDVTERERTEAMRRHFVANVSHEIRTPLTVVAGFVETLRTLELSEAERQRVLQLMHEQAQRMQALVADLLVLAQLEGSARPQVNEWHDLRHLMTDALATARLLSAGAHELRATIPKGVEVAGNGSELLSALSNLLNNAVRYTPAGGVVELSYVAHANGTLQIDVRDSGIGVAREHLPRLTERFYRVDQGRSRNTGGTGLGLAIVKHVMQRHGGELLVQSELRRGSVFSMVLPGSRLRLAGPDPVALLSAGGRSGSAPDDLSGAVPGLATPSPAEPAPSLGG